MNKNFVLVVVGALVGALLLGAGAFLNKLSVQHPAGSVTGPAVDGQYFTIGGMDYYHFRMPITASSTVPCYVPSNRFGAATSTIVSASLTANTNGLGAVTLDFSTTTSAGGFGTSSPALERAFSIAAVPTQPFIWGLASTTNTLVIGLSVGSGFNGGTSGVFVRPGEGLTFRVATGTPGTFTSFLGGTCEVVLRKL